MQTHKEMTLEDFAHQVAVEVLNLGMKNQEAHYQPVSTGEAACCYCSGKVLYATEEDIEYGCIVGHGIKRVLGNTDEVNEILHYCDNRPSGYCAAVTIMEVFDKVISTSGERTVLDEDQRPAAIKFLTHVQNAQDKGKSWGKAVQVGLSKSLWSM